MSVGVGLVALWAAGAGAEAIIVPPGFRVDVFASGLGAPRALAFDPTGVLLVSIPGQGRIVALPDRKGRGQADDIVPVADNIDRPHGLAFRQGSLYVAATGRVWRFRYDPATLAARDPIPVVHDLPAGGHHWTRTIVFGPDGRLYVAVGSSCDICREHDRRRAAIVRYDAGGGGEHLVATGLRNPVGLAFHPVTGALWTTVNERDWRGGGAPPDFIAEVTDGASYGWPDCYVSGGTFTPDPEFRGAEACRAMTAPAIELPPHSAPLGLAFYTGRRFPASYRGSLFVALHGSRAGLPPAGYKVVRVTFHRGRPASLEDFSTGWIVGARVVGRPVDVIVAPDGALFVSDDHGGRIFRISYRP